jgi:hypothetical protein
MGALFDIPITRSKQGLKIEIGIKIEVRLDIACG